MQRIRYSISLNFKNLPIIGKNMFFTGKNGILLPFGILYIPENFWLQFLKYVYSFISIISIQHISQLDLIF